jgi:hypothetical protein
MRIKDIFNIQLLTRVLNSIKDMRTKGIEMCDMYEMRNREKEKKKTRSLSIQKKRSIIKFNFVKSEPPRALFSA